MKPAGLYGLASAASIARTIRHRKRPNSQGKRYCENYNYDSTHSTITMEKFEPFGPL